jgi:hypothetical protein
MAAIIIVCAAAIEFMWFPSISIWNLGGSNDVFVPSAKFLRHHVMDYLGISIIF